MRKAVILAVVAMLCIAGVAYLVSMAHAGITIYVPGDYSTIQAAINAASNGDTIIVSNDTYTGSSNKNLDPLDKSITIKSANGPVNCIIDCQNSGRGFLIQRGEGNGTVIDGFTIEDANEANGAGILVAGSSSPIIKNCRLISNNAYWNNGGGIAIENYSDPKIIDCYINSNSANWGGAGIHISNHSDPEITDCTISSNSAGLNGGGIECNGSCSPTITGCNLTENSASSGGGGIA